MSSVRICGDGDLPDGTARRFDAGGHCVALVRIGGDYFAIGDTCSHADYSLSDGEVDDFDCTLECPKHGSLFDLRTGEPLTLPATRPVAAYEVSVVEGGVYVELPRAGGEGGGGAAAAAEAGGEGTSGGGGSSGPTPDSEAAGDQAGGGTPDGERASGAETGEGR